MIHGDLQTEGEGLRWLLSGYAGLAGVGGMGDGNGGTHQRLDPQNPDMAAHL